MTGTINGTEYRNIISNDLIEMRIVDEVMVTMRVKIGRTVNGVRAGIVVAMPVRGNIAVTVISSHEMGMMCFFLSNNLPVTGHGEV